MRTAAHIDVRRRSRCLTASLRCYVPVLISLTQYSIQLSTHVLFNGTSAPIAISAFATSHELY